MSLEGCLDRVEDGRARGWALDNEKSDQVVEVSILIDGQKVGGGKAKQFRRDLADIYLDRGLHGFDIQLDPKCFDGSEHDIEAVALGPPDTTLWSTFRRACLDSSQKSPKMTLLFDEEFYVQQAGASAFPLTDYQTSGWKKGYDPHPLFSSSYYAENLGREIVDDPLSDFISFGGEQASEVHPLFDVVRYLRERPDVAAARVHPLVHYLEFGWPEQVNAFRFFDWAYYSEDNEPLAVAGIAPIIHYLTIGWRDDLSPARDFLPSLYAKVAGLADGVEPLSHFARTIGSVGRAALTSKQPRVSVIILNFNKALLTLQCIEAIYNRTDMSDVEIIVVDNGSTADNFRLLASYGRAINLIRLPANLGFGEANNLGAERALGEILIFLNNDAFVMEGWLPPLVGRMDIDQTVGAVAPMFLFPNGLLQEAGGSVEADGTSHQFGKGLSPDEPMFNVEREVTYASAAALAVRKALFFQAYGFDLCWDPAYYEDTDLCLKLQALGYKVIYTPKSKVTHIEGSTSRDPVLNLGLHDVVQVNRMKFFLRWGDWLSGRTEGLRESLLPPRPCRSIPTHNKPRFALFSPFALTPGGGERYLLTAAALLGDLANFTLITPNPCSYARLATLGRELDLALDQLQLATLEEALSLPRFDYQITMGNEVIPSIPAFATHSFFHCQFPFPLEDSHYVNHWGMISGYSGVIVNSRYTAAAYADAQVRLLGAHLPVHIVSPPAPQCAAPLHKPDPHRIRKILHVGRFFPGDHCKRQDVMIEAFRALVALADGPIELHLAGSVGAGGAAREYLMGLRDQAVGLPVRFHVNASAAEMQTLYAGCDFYWHMTGAEEDPALHPERFEHFGISVVEAMSAGLIPVCLKHGGPGEIISHGADGYLVSGARELIKTTADLLERNDRTLAPIRAAAIKSAARFAPARYCERICAITGLTWAEQGRMAPIQFSAPIDERHFAEPSGDPRDAHQGRTPTLSS